MLKKSVYALVSFLILAGTSLADCASGNCSLLSRSRTTTRSVQQVTYVQPAPVAIQSYGRSGSVGATAVSGCNGGSGESGRRKILSGDLFNRSGGPLLSGRRQQSPPSRVTVIQSNSLLVPPPASLPKGDEAK